MKKNQKSKIIIIAIILFISIFNINMVFSADYTGGNKASSTYIGGNSGNTVITGKGTKTIAKLDNPLKAESVKEVLYLAVDLAMNIGIIFAILAIIYVGFKFVEAQGNQEKLKEAKKWFFSIIIGLAVLISAKVIVEIVKSTLIDSGVVDEKVFNNTKI